MSGFKTWQTVTKLTQEQNALHYEINLQTIGVSAITICALSVLRRCHAGAIPSALVVAPLALVVAKASPPGNASALQEKRQEQFTKLDPSIALEATNKNLQKATETLPQLFYRMDLSSFNPGDLKLPEALQSIKHFETGLQGMKWSVYGCMGLSAFHGLKMLKESYHFATSLKMPPIRSAIPSAFRFGMSCLLEESGVMGNAFLSNIKLRFSKVILDRISDLVQSQHDLAAERIQCAVQQKIQLAMQQSETCSSFLEDLKPYLKFVKELKLEKVQGERFVEIAPHLTHLTELTITGAFDLTNKEEAFKNLKSLTYLKIAKNDSLNDESLKAVLNHLPNLREVIIEETSEVKGDFWEAVPGTVRILEMPEFNGAPQLGAGNFRETYIQVTIGKISGEGASQLQRSLYADQLTLSSLKKPGETAEAEWKRSDLNKTLQGGNISKIDTPLTC